MDSSTQLILTIVSVVGGAIVIGVASAFAWFKSSKARLYKKVQELEDEVTTYANTHQAWHSENKEKLIGLKIHQEYMEKALSGIKDSSDRTTRSIERLLEALVSAKNGDNGHER